MTDIHQLRTFVTVAREGSITRASERLHLSQPAVSAHIKALEDAFELALFERTARGMSLTDEGRRLLARAEGALDAHQQLADEAARLKGRVGGRLRLGARSNVADDGVAAFLVAFAARCPGVDVTVEHGSSAEIVARVRAGTLDAGFYNEAGDEGPDLTTIETSRFDVVLVARPGLVDISAGLDWALLAGRPWIYPPSSVCCGRAAERLLAQHDIRPSRVVTVDRESVTRALVAEGVGIGLLHGDTAEAAASRGEVAILHVCSPPVRVLFAHLTRRADEPVLSAAASIVRRGPGS